ncbi:MAG: hypothetical protein S4CHLAM102_07740 [Chlamydiia bacterium]|nr:hypothetical protein [Chlamydiia bacterium]
MKVWVLCLIWAVALPIVGEEIDLNKYWNVPDDPMVWTVETIRPGDEQMNKIKRSSRKYMTDASLFVLFSVSNVPKNRAYQLYFEGLAGIFQLQSFTESNGTLVLENDPKVNICECPQGIEDYLKGEGFRFHLVDEKNEMKLTREIFPNPFEASVNGKTLRIELISLDNFFWVKGMGFSPNEDVELTTHSGLEITQQMLQVDGDGEIGFIIAPEIVGLEGSPAKISVRDLRNERIELKYAWGTELYRMSKQ